MNKPDCSSKPSGSVSRRNFLKTIGTTAVAGAAAQAESIAAELQKVDAEKIQGPGPVPITLTVNGKKHDLELEPRVTLLDALRNFLNSTGAKEVCDRGTCGACTVLIDGKPVYACMQLAIESQGCSITTVEALAQGNRLSKIQQAFIEEDALMCGYCTPGFLMSATALLQRQPKPTADDVRHACAGNVCRCGTHPRVLKAILKTAGVEITQKTEVIRYADLA
ncbi:MAG TPA: (2Fe-2S)-binding protein [Candidatus Paceibacterota bacterium]|nr:(2Fe-2S)-binding protein [Verrucomicrobiota bacterium]HRY49025.1 (2Fe-2S)-binding protein [Candidatus Paceibacterota bacterium]HSA02419.1 (2Fe-2S)-binding protein [Candidatus Paceibacterota bacterium]